MCVRCGTGTVAWCTSLTRHRGSAEPVEAATEENLTPHAALRRIERALASLPLNTSTEEAMNRLWELVLKSD